MRFVIEHRTTTAPPALGDRTLDLLRLEARTIWGTDGDRLAGATVVATVIGYDGSVEVLAGTHAARPSDPVVTTTARSWRLTGANQPRALPEELRIVTGATADLRPATGWSDADWRDLGAGGLGPWVGLAADNRVVSLAHCARLTDEAAEVGVQTDEAFRGRGLAPIVVQAWAQRMGDARVLFYSAFEQNHASHRVAAACNAQPLGLLSRIALSEPAGQSAA